MRHLIYILGLLLLTIAPLHSAEKASYEHLHGIHFLYMQIDESLDKEITAMERLDLSDIMELQMRRREIDIRPFITNQPERCVPVVVLSIDTSDRLKTGEFDLVLQLRDRVTIKRNKSEVTATTFELRRTGRADSNEVATIKQVLRELMADFVDAFREQNPLRSKTSEEE